MKTIVFIVPSLSNGGAERVAVNVANQLSETYNVKILSFNKTVSNYGVNQKADIEYLFDGKTNIIKKIRTIREKIKEIKPDFIFPFLDYICIYATFSLFFTKYRKRVFCTLRVNPKYSKNKCLFNLAVRLSNKFIVQNEGEKNFYRGKIKDKIVVIPNPISEQVKLVDKKYSNELNEICCVGRLNEQKNYFQMLRVFSRFKNKKLFIYGKGPEEDRLKNLSKELKIDDRVIFCGYTSNVFEAISKHDLYVMTSNFEGMPNSLMEAMGLGLPSISSNCDYGPDELIDNEKNGLIYNLESDDDLFEKIKSIDENYENAINMGKNARKHILENYNNKKVIGLWKQLIEKEGEKR